MTRRAHDRGLLLAAPALVLAGALALLALAPRVAEAHALLIRSDPPVNARLRDAPAKVTAFFSESLDSRLSSMQVLDGTGARVDNNDVKFGPDPTQMAVTVKALKPGFYTVTWQTLSADDGHLLKGNFPFTVLNPDGSEPSGPRFQGAGSAGYAGGGPKVLATASRWVGYGSIAAIVGGLAFALWVVRPAAGELDAIWKRRVREATARHLGWVLWPALVLLALAGLGELLQQAQQLGGLHYITDVLRNSWGQRWIQRQLVLGAMFVALLASREMRRADSERLADAALWVTLAGGIGYLFLIATVSHGNAIAGSFWAVAADFVHLLATAVWIGMLVQLVLLLLWIRKEAAGAARPPLLAGHLARFSTFAATAVVLLLASGAVNGLAQIPVPQAMFDTAYGRSLTVKLCLMGLLLVVAGINAFYLRPKLAGRRGDPADTRRLLTRVTQAEIGLALAVLLAAAVLVQYPTSRQVQAAQQNVQASAQSVVGFEQVQVAGGISVDLSISPNAAGTNSYRVFLFPTAGTQMGEVQRVRLRFKPPNISLGESQVIAEPAGLNAWKAVGPFFSQPGAWEVDVDLRRTQVQDVTAIFRPDVAGASVQAGGGRFAYPLEAGRWLTVAGVGALVLALLFAIWVTQWPRLPSPAPRLLRVGSAAVGVLGLGIVFGVVWGLVPGETASGNPIAPTGQSIAIGRELFLSNCSRCHGKEGRGDGPDANSLSVRPADVRQHIPYHTDTFFFQVISNGLGDFMPPFAAQLKEDERWDIINFLKAQFGEAAQQAEQQQATPPPSGPAASPSPSPAATR